MLERGHCAFAEKVKNVQTAGGHGVIIVNTEIGNSNVENLIMSEVG